MADAKGYYQALGVSESASTQEIKKAYRELAKKLHPDRTKGNKQDEERFKKVNEAYEVLSDPDKRKEYDELSRFGGFYNQGGGPGGFSYQHVGTDGFAWDIGDIFSNIRHGYGVAGDWSSNSWSADAQLRPTKGRDLTVVLNITFDEAFQGVKKTVTYRIPSTREKKTMTVDVPAGAVDDGQLRLKKLGEFGTLGGSRGDLIVVTKIKKHKLYERDGAHVVMKLPLSPAEAALGGSFMIPAPSGKNVRVKIEPGTQHGAQLRLKGLGAPRVKRPSVSGDLRVVVEIVVPKTLSDEEKFLYKQLVDLQSIDVRSRYYGTAR